MAVDPHAPEEAYSAPPTFTEAEKHAVVYRAGEGQK
jgi:hypothetical protein